MRAPGFILVVTIICLFLIAGILMLLQVQMLAGWVLTAGTEGQLHSMVLASNGIEYARSLLPRLDLDRLAAGLDGVTCPHPDRSGWRDPVDFKRAQSADLENLGVVCDDGWPFQDSRLLIPHGYGAPGPGRFFIRFSPSPAELDTVNREQTFLVRSLGVVPHRLPGLAGGIRNHVTLVEATLRLEREFDPEAALTVMTDALSITAADGGDWEIVGGDGAALACLGEGSAAARRTLLAALAEAASTRLRVGPGREPVVDLGERWRQDSRHSRLYDGSFWDHFEASLDRFADPFDPEAHTAAGLFWFPEGGRLAGDVEGVVVARGDLVIESGSSIRGLLLHLGQGRLELESQARISGAAWMSNLPPVGERSHTAPLRTGSVELVLHDQSRISYDSAAAAEGLACFPPTLLRWRILFPEMQR